MPKEIENIATKHVRFLEMTEPEARVDFHALGRKGKSRKIVLTLLNECRRIVVSKFKIKVIPIGLVVVTALCRRTC